MKISLSKECCNYIGRLWPTLVGDRKTGMARYFDIANTFCETYNEPGVTTIVYCKLFRDIVTDTVCILRSRILTAKSHTSCKGCIMNIALDRRLC